MERSVVSGRVIRKWLVLLVVVVVGGVVILYVLASWVPTEYRPARLSQKEKEKAADRLDRRISEFVTHGEDVKPFTWSMTQEWLNRYLSSMDEIARLKGGRRGRVDGMIARAGLADPMVVLTGGAITVLARSTKYDKIISARVVFEFTAGGKLGVRLASARMGRVPMPVSVIRGRIGKLKRSVARRLGEAKGSKDWASVGAAKALGRVIAAIDGEPIDAELSWRLHTKKRVRIERIVITDGLLTLHVVPVGRGEPEE